MFRNFLVWLFKKYELVVEPTLVFAHCDIPCGVYETDTMLHAVETIKSLTKKLLELKTPDDDESKDVREYTNTAGRMVLVKEEYAQICKKEVLILWTDFFNSAHLKKYPNLHEIVWGVTKLCSSVKREVNIDKVNELESKVKELSKIFKEIKSSK